MLSDRSSRHDTCTGEGTKPRPRTPAQVESVCFKSGWVGGQPIGGPRTRCRYCLQRRYGSAAKALPDGLHEVRVTDTGFTLFFPPTKDASEPIPGQADSTVTLHLPDRAVIFQKGLRTDFFNVIHMVPLSDTTCRVEWMTRQPGDTPLVEWWPEEPRTLEQDRLLQESAQLNYSRTGPEFERNVPADYATLLARKILRIAREDRWPEDRSTLVQRKLVMVRQ